jgi:hypothetical protein
LTRQVAWAVGLGLWSLGCAGEPPNEPVEPTETIVLVQGVVRADQRQQWVLLERTFNGTVSGYSWGFIPGGEVAVPLEGADVTISNLSFPEDPCGASVTLLESLGPAGQHQPGVYWSPDACPTIRSGDTLELLVVSGDDRVTGRTVVPGTNQMVLETAGGSVLVPGPALEFNRDTDTLMATVDPVGGRVLIIEIRDRIFAETPDWIAEASSQFWVDGTSLTVPGDFLDLFQDLDDDEPIPDLFNAGRWLAATLAYADQNFYDQLRSANSPLTGRGFINNLEGGFGYFGSMTAARNNLRVIGNADDPREGLYHMTGTVDGVAVSVDWELYLNSGTDDSEPPFSSFVEGDWVLGAYDAYVVGTFSGSSLTTWIVQPTGGTTPEGEMELRFWEVTGALSPTEPTTLTVRVDGAEVGTMTAAKQ